MGAVLLPIYIIIFIGLIYFVGVRPQQRRRKEQEGLLTRLKPGDDVVTLAGIYGKVTEIEEGGTLILEIAEDTEIRVATASISRLLQDEAAASPASSNKPE
jgi:preprotein translocase subunit YajC